MTEEKNLRCGAREAAEKREKQRQDAEKKRVYDEVCSSSHIYGAPIKFLCTQDPLKDNYGDRLFENQKSGTMQSCIDGENPRADCP